MSWLIIVFIQIGMTANLNSVSFERKSAMTLYMRLCLATLLAVILLTACLSSLVQSPANAQKPDTQNIVARVTVRSEQETKRLVTLGLDLLESREGNDLFIITTYDELEKLRNAGWQIKIDEAQTSVLQRSQNVDTFLGGYRTVPEMRAFVDALAARWPNHVEVVTYGQSWEKVNSGGTAGHDLFAVKLTNRQRPGPKPTILITASIHARELVTSEIALRLMEYLVNNYGFNGDVNWLLNDHLIVIVPTVNPDGRRLAEQGYFQRKNTNTSYGGGCSNPPASSNHYGVDLNRNFNFKWGTVNTPSEPKCGQTYPGPSAASEPEGLALQNLMGALFADQRGPLDTDPAPQTTTGVFIDLHSTGNLVMWPWGHNSTVAPNGVDMELIGRKLASYNGYTPQQAIVLYPSSGATKDYAYGQLGIPAYTIEIGPGAGGCGGFMPPFGCLDAGSDGRFWERNLPALLYAAKIARAPYQLSKGPTPESGSASILLTNPVRIYTLRAQFSEQYNGGQNITAAECYLDTPPWQGGASAPMTPLDGSFDSPNEVAIVPFAQPFQTSEPYYVRARDSEGNWGPVLAISQSTPPYPNLTDFDGDARANFAVFRPSDGTWYMLMNPGNTLHAQSWGIAGDRITPADYDGDRKADIAVFRPSNSTWYILQSATGTLRATAWGVSEDIPAPGDYDYDGKVDVAVFRPSNGTWYVLRSTDGSLLSQQFGASTDKPVQGDYDRDSKTDFAVYRPGAGAGTWYVLHSSDGSFRAHSFGISGDRPVAGDFDGDRKTDIAVFRPSNGTWYIVQSSNNIFKAQQWGVSGDVPVPGDYDADGRLDVAVFRPGSGTWYAFKSSSGELLAQGWGTSGDVPAPAAYVP